jgi:hypothetical protein
MSRSEVEAVKVLSCRWRRTEVGSGRFGSELTTTSGGAGECWWFRSRARKCSAGTSRLSVKPYCIGPGKWKRFPLLAYPAFVTPDLCFQGRWICWPTCPSLAPRKRDHPPDRARACITICLLPLWVPPRRLNSGTVGAGGVVPSDSWSGRNRAECLNPKSRAAVLCRSTLAFG